MDAKTTLKKTLERIGSAILKMRIVLNWLTGGSDVGYTMQPDMAKRLAKICVAYESEAYGSLSSADKKVLRSGIYAHELSHQLQTDFKYGLKVTKKVDKEYDRETAAMFHTVVNVLEDPAIEYHAALYFGGMLLDALNFSIAYFWEASPEVSEAESGWGQFISAYINVGDLGKVKGDFTIPEAKKAFDDSIALFNEGVHEDNPKRRVDIAKEIFFLPSVRALWEKEKADREAMRKAIQKMLDDIAATGDGEPMATPKVTPEEMPEEIKKSVAGKADEARKKTEKKAEKAKAEAKAKAEGAEEGSEGGKGGSSEAEEKSEGGKAAASGKADDDKSEAKSGKAEDAGKDTEGKADAETGDRESEGGSESGESGKKSDTESEAIEEAMKKALESASESLKKEMDKEVRAAEKAARDGALPEAPDTTIDDAELRGASNRDIRADEKFSLPYDGKSYAELKSEYSMPIHVLTKTLEKIFREDEGGEMWATSGKYDITRGYIGTTARMFSKPILPSDKTDAAVLLLIDCSGSMRFERRYDAARKAAIVMGESLRKMKVPFAVVGFSADQGTDSEMIHFVTWSDKTSEMENLALIQPDRNNFDSYAIRSATKMLSQRHERNKYLFVISDGIPSCHFYHRHGVSGHEDTKKALQQAERVCHTFGIGIGSSIDENEFTDQYHGRFIHVEDLADLTHQLSCKLAKVFKA